MDVTSRSLTLFFITLASLCHAENNFLLTLPKAIYAGSKTEFCLTAYNDIKVTIDFISLRNVQDTPVLIKDSYSRGEQKCTNFQAPPQGEYRLEVTTQSTEPGAVSELHNSTKVTVHGSKLITFIQTDKPMYKPGQKVMFRVFTLMRNLKPRTENIKSIYVLDPNDVRVKQFLDVEQKGIGSFEFQLIEEAKLGPWKIEVYLDDEDEVRQQATVQEFEVKEYVLPRFEVLITAPNNILITDKNIKGKVCAQYTYGKPVSGFVHIELKTSTNLYRYSPSDSQEQVKQISGCYEFSFDIPVEKHYTLYSYKLNVTVTEKGTGVVVNNVFDGPKITYEPLTIEIEDFTKGFFKPGLPYYGKVTVKKIDGSPAEGEKIIVSTQNEFLYAGEFITDSNGTFLFSLCEGLTNNRSSVQISAEALGYNSSRYITRGFKTIQQWYSPSRSYVQIPPAEAQLKCSGKVSLTVPFTTKENSLVQFYYQVIARGNLVKSGHIIHSGESTYDDTAQSQSKCLRQLSEEERNETLGSIHYYRPSRGYYQGSHDDTFLKEVVTSDFQADKVSFFVLDLDVVPVMSPQFNVLVYHILPDGEVVADGRDFSVQPCFENQVEMTFSKTTVAPGEKVDVFIGAQPASICGLGVVDKSINLLGGNHQVTPEMVFKKIEEFNLVPPPGADEYFNNKDYQYCMKNVKSTSEGQDHEDYFWILSSPFVDALQAFEASGFTVVTDLKLETRPCSRRPQVFYAGKRQKKLQSNIKCPKGDLCSMFSKLAAAHNILIYLNAKSLVRGTMEEWEKAVREIFPETWLWDISVVGDSGAVTLHETAPDTITSWIGNVLCVHPETGFGASPVTSLRTFQPFFLSLQLPYAAVRGEKLPIMLTVYNYLEKCLHIKMALDMEKNFAVDKNELLKEPVCVCGGKSHTVKIYVTPKGLGYLPIIAKAEIIPGLCSNTIDVDTQYIGLSDAVKRQMFVKAEGIEQVNTNTMFVCSKVDSPKQEELVLSVPSDEEIVKDSIRGELKVIGDIMGPALTNLDRLVKLPTGCGEQNMVGFVPNIFALKYLTETRRITDEIKSKALKFMEVGYQRELTFRHIDGSYSAFGDKDPQGSIWLTAFVVKSYAQAQPYIYIDEKDLQVSLKYLHLNQLETGCYRETGRVLGSYMMGGLKGDNKEEESFTALTAYVVIALLTAGVNSSQPGIYGAMECINADFDSLREQMDPYALALVAYANALYAPSSHRTSEIIAALEAVARTEGDFKYWARKDFQPKVSNSWYTYSMPSAEVEMTAYVLLTYIKLFGPRAVERTHNIAMWLSKQRSPYGGFSSTQDTVVGLNALSEYSRLAFNGGKTELKVSITGSKLKQTFSLSQKKKTTLLLHRASIPVLPNQISLISEGEGCALVQFSVFYNKLSKEFKDKSSFHLEVNPSHYKPNKDKCDHRSIVISAGTKGKARETSGMVLIELKLVTGWTPLPESLTKIQLRFVDIKKIEYNENEGLIAFYFDQLSGKPIEFTLDVKQDLELGVSNPKPADVKVYYYYEKDVFKVQSYKIKTTCGTKEEIPHKNTDPEFGPEGPNQVRINPGIDAPFTMSSDGCPVCIPVSVLPLNFKDLICRSSAVYKVAIMKGKTVKLLQDLRPPSLVKKINIVVELELPPGCTCGLLTNQGKKALLLVKKPITADSTLVKLDNTSVITLEDKKFTKTTRNTQKTCPLKKLEEKKKKHEKS
nr:alpha-2-macroglobulin isoform C [Biomphalaria glabrata]